MVPRCAWSDQSCLDQQRSKRSYGRLDRDGEPLLSIGVTSLQTVAWICTEGLLHKGLSKSAMLKLNDNVPFRTI